MSGNSLTYALVGLSVLLNAYTLFTVWRINRIRRNPPMAVLNGILEPSPAQRAANEVLREADGLKK